MVKDSSAFNLVSSGYSHSRTHHPSFEERCHSNRHMGISCLAGGDCAIPQYGHTFFCSGKYLAAPQGFGDVLYPPNRHLSRVHFNERFLSVNLVSGNFILPNGSNPCNFSFCAYYCMLTKNSIVSYLWRLVKTKVRARDKQSA